MSKMTTISFKIKGIPPNGLPIARLAEYLKELSFLYGHSDNIHFKNVTKGSAVLNFPAEEKVERDISSRVKLAAVGNAEESVQKHFNKLNALLRQDNTSGVYQINKRKVVEFPGIKEKQPEEFSKISQAGSLQGKLLMVGGTDDSVPIWLKDFSGEVQKNINVNKSLAKELGSMLFEPLRLTGGS